MLKYVNTGVVFQEIPDETTLSINISGCPNHCPGCHSKYLWADIGEELNTDAIDSFVKEFNGDFTAASSISHITSTATPLIILNSDLILHI